MLTKSLFEQALGIKKPWYIQDIKFDVAKKQMVLLGHPFPAGTRH